jgi:hypothetical protein
MNDVNDGGPGPTADAPGPARRMMQLAGRVAGGADVPNWVYLLLLLLNAVLIGLNRMFPGAVPPPPANP